MEERIDILEIYSKDKHMHSTSGVNERLYSTLDGDLSVRLYLQRNPAVRVVAEHDRAIHRPSSFPLLPVSGPFAETFRKQEPGPMLRGPRRMLRLCVFAVVIPLLLVLVPMYVRLVVYAPQHLPMAPTDQRIINTRVSSIWCQSQTIRMNGSFNAYLVPRAPVPSAVRTRHTILRKLMLEDDIKEYWGFYLQKGSTVTLSTCTRFQGGQLLILRGADNLHRCAWIGEKDSMEEANNDLRPSSADLANLRMSSSMESDEHENEYNRKLFGSGVYQSVNINEELHSIPIFLNSNERQEHLKLLIRKAVHISRGESEIFKILKEHHKMLNQKESHAKQRNDTINGTYDFSMPKSNRKSVNLHSVNTTLNADIYINEEAFKYNENITKRERVQNLAKVLEENTRDEENINQEQINLEDIDRNTALEESDTKPSLRKRYIYHEITGVEQIIGSIKIPQTLKYERGVFNQTTANDWSMSEETSSYSSSEEALASCEGVILALPLQPDSRCNSLKEHMSNKITYDITVTGNYYFVFSSDNEIVTNILFFNLTLDKVVYNTSESLEGCMKASNCSLNLGFWSEQQTVVEVPSNNQWDESYIMETRCEPRIAIYLCFMMLVPVVILCCAFR